MQSLFNKRNKSPQEANNIFSQPPTSIIQSQIVAEPSFKVSKQQKMQEEEVQDIHETEQQKQQKLSRTIFIGNVKLQTNKKELKKLLETFGKVEKVWYRSIPTEQSKIGPKASFILKKFQQNAESMNAYARFQDISSVNKSLDLNGKQFNGLTLRVSAADNKELDFQKTLFIGNLPFDTNPAGTILNIRIIRNKFSHQGIGIAYIMLSSSDQMKNCIKNYNGKLFRERKLRIKKAVQKKRLDKKKKKFLDPKQTNRNAALKRIQQRNKESVKSQKNKQSSKTQSQIPVYNKKDSSKVGVNETKRVVKDSSKVGISQKKRPQVVRQDTEQDKQLRNEVSQQLKLLKKKMIQKKK